MGDEVEKKPLKLVFNYRAWDSFNGTNMQSTIRLRPTRECRRAIGDETYGISMGFSQDYKEDRILSMLAEIVFNDFKDRGADPTVTFYRRNEWLEQLRLKNTKTEITVQQP